MVRDLPVTWMSANNADIRTAGKYEGWSKSRGVEPDSSKLTSFLGGDIVHLRLTKLSNGLRYVTIHKEDGTQIFDDTAYRGLSLIPRRDSGIQDSPAVSSPGEVYDADLGDGFSLRMTLSEQEKGHGRTSTFAEKRYRRPDGTQVELHYSIKPKSPIEIEDLNITYEAVSSASTRADMATWTAKVVQARSQFYQGSHLKSLITISYRFGQQWDQVSFYFGPNGKLFLIMAKSNIPTPHPDWSEPKFLRAIGQGSGTSFQYGWSDPAAAIIFRTVFGKDISTLERLSLTSVQSILNAVTEEKSLNLVSLLSFRK